MTVPDDLASRAEATLSLALEATVRRFRQLILGVGRRHGLPESDVDDVVQEVRLRLWRNRGDSETLEQVGASYVYRIAVSAAIDTIRRRRAARTGSDVVADLDETTAPARENPAREVEDRELAGRVFEAVGDLMPSRRPVVRMYLAGYDREEIARALGCTVGKVRNLLSRGLADLRVALAARGIGPGGTT